MAGTSNDPVGRKTQIGSNKLPPFALKTQIAAKARHLIAEQVRLWQYYKATSANWPRKSDAPPKGMRAP
ncbi:hypothetical protein SAMN04488030_2478 [Aliiroseovarius halocynthiae]|nr:hypothetical protein SAMN04488030_2478 [Aliiroseovarius halocynthiae]